MRRVAGRNRATKERRIGWRVIPVADLGGGGHAGLRAQSSGSIQVGPRRAGILSMSTRYNDGSHYENHQRAAELHDGAAHAHRAADKHNQQEHLTGNELTRQALEHSPTMHEGTEPTVGHGIAAFGHNEIAELAHQYWMERGSPEGSGDEDWFRAVKELRSRAYSR